MAEPIGRIVRLQVQVEPVKHKGVGYDPAPIAAVERAAVGPDGMVGRAAEGWLVDAHHRAHPNGHGGGRRALSIGFTGHYEAMAERFGDVPVGIAGENIIVEGPPLRLGDLGGGVEVATAAGVVRFLAPRVAAPCREFTCFLRGYPELLPREELEDDLAFLEDGTRGYILEVSHLAGPVEIAVGDLVSVIA